MEDDTRERPDLWEPWLSGGGTWDTWGTFLLELVPVLRRLLLRALEGDCPRSPRSSRRQEWLQPRDCAGATGTRSLGTKEDAFRMGVARRLGGSHGPCPLQTNMGMNTHMCTRAHTIHTPLTVPRFVTSRVHLWTVVHAPEL